MDTSYQLTEMMSGKSVEFGIGHQSNQFRMQRNNHDGDLQQRFGRRYRG